MMTRKETALYTLITVLMFLCGFVQNKRVSWILVDSTCTAHSKHLVREDPGECGKVLDGRRQHCLSMKVQLS